MRRGGIPDEDFGAGNATLTEQCTMHFNCMPYTTVPLRQDGARRLRESRGAGESYSDVLDRLLDNEPAKSVQEWMDSLAPLEGRKLRKVTLFRGDRLPGRGPGKGPGGKGPRARRERQLDRGDGPALFRDACVCLRGF